MNPPAQNLSVSKFSTPSPSLDVLHHTIVYEKNFEEENIYDGFCGFIIIMKVLQ